MWEDQQGKEVFLQGFKDCELLWDNEFNDDGGLIQFELMVESEPIKTEEALSGLKWICAMKKEIESIEKKKTCELVDLSERKNSIGVRWVYKVKANLKGKIIKHNARLVAKGFLQREWIDFKDVFTSVARIETIKLIIGIANNNK